MNIRFFIVSALILYFTSTALADKYSLKLPNGREVNVVKADITQTNVDIIVNAANKELLAGGGVCGAIFKAAGHDLLQNACFAFKNSTQGIRCAVGTACITPSFNLVAKDIKHIIHAVGPDCRIIHDSYMRKSLLTGAYTSSLALAEQHQAQSIAFPCISAAIYAYPKEQASKIAFETVLDFLNTQAKSLKLVQFIVFENEDCILYKKLLKDYFKQVNSSSSYKTQ